jgi:hypothetical protein
VQIGRAMCRARADSEREARRHFRMQVRDAFSLGSFSRERAVIKETVTRAGLVRCELGDKASIVIVQGGVDAVQLGVR